MLDIIYTSLYSKACDFIGRSKPQSQEEEDWCLMNEAERPEWAFNVRKKMIKNAKPHIADSELESAAVRRASS